MVFGAYPLSLAMFSVHSHMLTGHQAWGRDTSPASSRPFLVGGGKSLSTQPFLVRKTPPLGQRLPQGSIPSS